VADLDALWHDDRLIEAAAHGDILDTDDPAAGALMALARVGDDPLPPLDIDALIHQAERHASTRYAVRSLAAAVTVVATLSASGVSAVVTGDPFRPAKAVWQQIQDHTRAPFGATDEDWASHSVRAHAGAEQAAADATERGARPARNGAHRLQDDDADAASRRSAGAVQALAPGAAGPSDPMPAFEPYEDQSADAHGTGSAAAGGGSAARAQPTGDGARDAQAEGRPARARRQPADEKDGGAAEPAPRRPGDAAAGEDAGEPAGDTGETGDGDAPAPDPDDGDDTPPGDPDGESRPPEPDPDQDEDPDVIVVPTTPPSPELPGTGAGMVDGPTS
jgi:hypothetical protein